MTARFLRPFVFVSLFCFCLEAEAQSTADLLKAQGEYTGELALEEGTIEVGFNLVAGKDNQLSISMYVGGLPGDGGQPIDQAGEDKRIGKLVDGRVELTLEDQKGVVEDGVFKVYEKDRLVGELKRVQRKSETLGMAPPDGATVLFDGSSGEHFTAKNGVDPMIEDALRQGITSKQKFGGDFTVHIEFKLPFEPEKSGQGRGNSGIYVQGRYEVQMLDSFGLSGEHNECGGIYSVKKPDINMCYPPESWQTYDIEFKSATWDGDRKTANAQMTVKHNGVTIHENVEVPKATTAAPLKESAEPGYLYLQDHGSPVRYRNIWVIEK